MKENRVYVDGKLVNICYNEYALFCNMCNYINLYGKDRVVLKRLEQSVNDEEKKIWLENLSNEVK